MYSQNQEDVLISELFDRHIGPEYVGSLISIGENDGITLSNSRKFIEKGWHALLVEPSEVCFEKLAKLYEHDPKVVLEKVCIGSNNTVVEFHESASLLNTGDYGLVSTIDDKEKSKWSKRTTYKTYTVDMVTVDRLLEKNNVKSADYLSIDAEGLDLEIFRQFDLSKLNCKVVVVEWNGKNIEQFNEHARSHNFKLKHKNAENLIYSIW